MSSTRPSADLEFKAAPAMLEARPAASGTRRATVPGAAQVDPDTGEVTALAAISGQVDDVNDIIEVGAIEAALQRRTPRLVVGHDWARPAGQIVEARELRPGDPALPRTAPDGSPWPRDAGALWIKARYLPTREGQDQRAIAQAFAGAMNYSIGYRVRPGGSVNRRGVRHISDLEIFECSPVLHGAHRLATQLDVKSGAPAALEVKSTDQATLTARRRTGAPFSAVRCSICGQVAGGSTGPISPHVSLICAGCLAAVDEIGERFAEISPAELSEADLDASAEAMYEQAIADEQQFELNADGTLREAGADDPAVGQAWRPGSGGQRRPGSGGQRRAFDG